MAVSQAHYILVEEVSTPQASLVLVGTSRNGPVNAPFMVDPNFDIEDVLGEGPLTTAYNFAYSSGLSNIILYRINGSHAEGTVEYQGEPVMKLTSSVGIDEANNIEIVFEPLRAVVKTSEGFARNYYHEDYRSVGQLVDAINLDEVYNIIDVRAHATHPSVSLLDLVGTRVKLTGGSNGEEGMTRRLHDYDSTENLNLVKANLAEALFGPDEDDQKEYDPNSILGIMNFGVICLVDMFHDDDQGFTEMLANFCYNKSIQGQGSCIGVLGTKPIYDPTPEKVSQRARELVLTPPYDDRTVPAVVTGGILANPYAYVQIVAADTSMASISLEKPTPISAAYSYAATQALIPYYSDMTNKTLSGIQQLNYEFSKEDIANLLSNGYISIVSSVRKGYVPYVASTAVYNKSYPVLRHPHVVRITHDVTSRISEYLGYYIGESLSISSRRTIEQGVDSLMVEYVRSGVIRSYALSFEYSMQSPEMRVQIAFITYSSVESVSSSVEMPFNRGVVV